MRSARFILVAWIAAAFSAAARGLEPQDIAVIFNTQSPGSLQVARHYMEVRKIPMNHLLPLTCDAVEAITEERYRISVVPQLLKALGDRKLLPDAKAGVAGVKCLVTTYDVPLRILAYVPTAAQNAEIAGYQKQLDEVTADLGTQLAAYENLAPAPATTTTAASATSNASAPASAPAAAPAKPTWQSLVPKLNRAIPAAAARINQLPAEQRAAAMSQYIQMQQHLAGLSGVLQSVTVMPGSPNYEAGRRHLQDVAAQLEQLQQQFNALMKQRDSARIRQEIISVRTNAEGIIGEAQALQEMIGYLRPDNSEACFDNELALLLADQSYSRANWVMNPANIENYLAYQRTPAAKLPALMVARLDGLTPAKAMELVDTAVSVEATGLEGKFYLDARGLHDSDAYSTYDADIRKTADWMKQHSTMETVLDDRPELFAAKDAPQCAVYCGWYSLRHYVDSCQWVKGAVGYHVASFEMMTLHDPHENGWVTNLLNRGFAGTLGPTDEPYLQSFPKPSLFFPLLLSGQFTQGEVWYLTTPMLSWRQGWVGDPLYNPFRVKPRVKVEDLMSDPILRNAFAALGRDVPAATMK